MVFYNMGIDSSAIKYFSSVRLLMKVFFNCRFLKFYQTNVEFKLHHEYNANKCTGLPMVRASTNKDEPNMT